MSSFVRVTSFNPMGKGFTVRGVPVDSKGIKTGTHLIRLDLADGLLQVEPAHGQMWSVKGDFEVLTRPTVDGKKMNTWHVYKTPQNIRFELPNKGESFIQFIALDTQFKRIGEKKARELWAEFDAQIFEMLKRGSGEDYKALLDSKILDRNEIKNLFAGFARYKNLEHSVWMTEAGIKLSTQLDIIKYHKLGTLEDIKSNPYELVHYGYKLSQIDSLRAQGGWGETDFADERLQAIASLALQKTSGSTFFRIPELRAKVRGLAGNQGNKAYVDSVMKCLEANETMAIVNEGGTVHPTSTAIQELAVAKRLVALSKVTQPFDEEAEQALAEYLDDLSYELTEKQKDAIRASVAAQVSCITGGAGTGKTTVLNGVLSVLESLGYEIHAVALSGRASMRLRESTGYGITIARLLRDDPLACELEQRKCLVIDEASMVDLPTMFQLVNHMSPHVKLILTGDPNQLPPIGAGKILKDIVDSGLVKNTMLDVVKRQEGSSGIPEYSNQVNAGEVPTPLKKGKVDFIMSSADGLIENAVKLYEMDPENSRVVAYTKAVTAEANKAIQEAVNPNGEPITFTMYGDSFKVGYLRKGDQVLFTENHYQEGIQNGSLGTLVSVETTAETDSSAPLFGVVELDNGHQVQLTQSLLDCLELGYAITLHKAQGSQFPRAIVLLEEKNTVDRSWVYTAITRAEEEVYLVGSEENFSRAVRNQPTAFRRNTALKELMRELCSQPSNCINSIGME